MVLIFVAFLVVRSTRASSAAHGAPGGPRPSSPVGRENPRHHRDLGLQPLGVTGSWKLILNSRFGASKLDTAVWRPGWLGSGTTGSINANEAACYSPANVSVSRRTALRLSVTRTPSRCAGGARPYTGAVLTTNPHDGRVHGGFSFRYGVIEAKVFLPGTTDSRVADWPAVVALGRVWPRDGEDDVMENLDGLVCAHFHSPGYAPGGNLGGCDPGVTPGWHIVASNWEPGSVTWYYDGIEIAHADKGITSSPLYLVLVNTVSRKAPDVARPDTMRVAYVRVWQRLRPAGRGR